MVASDISDDRRRIRLQTMLLGDGDPVQESVFECQVTPYEARELKRRARRLVRPPADRVRFYPICAECAAAIEDETGTRHPAPGRADRPHRLERAFRTWQCAEIVD